MSHELAVRTNGLEIRNMDELARAAKMMADSGFFADAREAAQAGVKIMAGQAWGIDPFSAMTGIYIINNRPTVSAGLMAAAVKGHPKYDYRVRVRTDKECRIEFFEGSESLGVSTYTVEMAKRAGLSGGTWSKHPEAMLFARAMSSGVRTFCPDVFSSSVYTPEELGAETDAEGNIIDVQPAPVRASVGDLGEPDAQAQEPEPEGMFPPEPEPEAAEILHAQGDVTPAQLKKLAIDMRKQGLEDRDVARAFMSWLFDRPITSSKELSKSEASRILGWSEDQWQQALLDYADASAGGPPEEDAA